MKPVARRTQYSGSKGAFAIWEKANALTAQGEDIIRMEIGEPDFPTPPHIVAAAHHAMQNGRTKYAVSVGKPSLRTAVADYFHRSRGIDADASCVLVDNGVKGVMFDAVMTLIDEGDALLVPDPGYPMYRSMGPMAGGISTPYALYPELGFQPDPDALRRQISSQTRAIMLCSPGNPTGLSIDQDRLEAIADLAIEHDLWVISDEVYAQIYFGDAPAFSIAQVPGMLERTILMDGLSKAYCMTGWRVGFGLFPKALVEPARQIITHSHSCVAPFIQDAAEAALTGPQDCVERLRTVFRERCEYVCERIEQMDRVSAIRPNGAFYIMVNVQDIVGLDEKPLANRLLDNGVSTLPCSGMGQNARGFLRLALNCDIETLAIAMDRFEATVTGYAT